MSLTLRPGQPEDATLCGTICYNAFKTIAEQHNFPSNYPSPEVAIARMVERLTHPGIYAVVAELDGRVVGSNFLDERSPIAGLGPITVVPSVQNRTIGRHLMQAARGAGKRTRAPSGGNWPPSEVMMSRLPLRNLYEVMKAAWYETPPLRPVALRSWWRLGGECGTSAPRHLAAHGVRV